MRRRCQAIAEGGGPCNAPPLRAGDHCFWHDPESQGEAHEARRLGGLRRRREATLAGVYDFDGLSSIADIRRLLEIAVTDTLELQNSVARSRTLAYLAQTALRCFEVGEVDARLAALETAVEPRAAAGGSRR